MKIYNKQILGLIMVFTLISASLFTNGAAAYQESWESKTYEIGDFSEIFLEGAFKVFLIQGDESLLKVKASDPVAFDYLNITNQNGHLHLHVDREPFDFSRVALYITFETLERLEIKGGVELRSRGYLGLEDFDVEIEGGAKLDIKAKARAISINSGGGVMFELEGVAESLDVKVSGAGHIDAEELICKDVTFKIEGVGTGSVFATETLDATINGVGKIKYRGNPQVTEHIDGLGSVQKD